MKKVLLFWFIFSLSSCGHFPVRTLPEHINSIYIPIFINQTFQYHLGEIITNTIIEAFIKDGRLEVVDKKSADAELKGKVISYEKVPFSYDRKGNITKYKLSITVSFELIDLRDDNLLWKDEYQEVILYVPSSSSYEPREFDITCEQEAINKILSKIAYYVVKRTM